MSMLSEAQFRSPRPTPRFMQEVTFSQKKESLKKPSTPREATAPRPPSKSVPPVSRLFFRSHDELRPRAVSFHKSDSISSLLQSPHYDARSRALLFDQCFDIVCKIGEGSFGEVFKVRSKEDGKIYAVKRSRDRFRGEGDKRRKLQEVNKHESLRNHPNVVGFHKAWAERGHLYIQAELCQKNLQEYSEHNHDIPEGTIFNFLIDLIHGVKHLHDHDLLHLDIKPDNIFIGIDGVCKLGDFGLTVELKKFNEVVDAQEGDPRYLAPELLQGKFGKHADVFSLGITILELATDLDLPRNGEAWHALRRGEIPWNLAKNISSDLRDIITSMMLPNYRDRPSLDDMLKLPVIQNVARKRAYALTIQRNVIRVKLFIFFIWAFILSVFSRIFSPLFALKKKLTSRISPPNQVQKMRRPSEWDLSFSDDELFESDISASSLGVPLSSSFSSSEEDSRVPLRLNPITPRHPLSASRIRRPLPRSSSPVPSPHLGARTVYPGSPNISMCLDFTQSPSGSPLKTPAQTPSKMTSSQSSSFHLEHDDLHTSLSSSIGPRSLAKEFDAATDDSE